jgi:protein-tyrosine phosphatase
MIDWHCHILPGVDDGPEDIRQSVALAASLADGGFTEVYCTPHLVRGCFETGNDAVRAGVAVLQERLNACGIPIALRCGREYCLDEYLQAALEDPLPLGDSRQILVEIPHHAAAERVRHLVYDVVRAGFTPVIAHPERCPLFMPPRRLAGNGGIRGPAETPLLSYLRELGCSFQGNLGSFGGFYGGRVRCAALSMRDAGIYDRYGSDLHAPEQAKFVLRSMPDPAIIQVSGTNPRYG